MSPSTGNANRKTPSKSRGNPMFRAGSVLRLSRIWTAVGTVSVGLLVEERQQPWGSFRGGENHPTKVFVEQETLQQESCSQSFTKSYFVSVSQLWPHLVP